MFIEQGIKPENKFWKYIVGSLVVILISSFGQIPLMIGIFAKSFSDGKGMPQLDEKSLMTYLEPNLTLFLIMLSFVFAMFGIYIVVKNIHKQTMLSVTTSRAKVDWSRILFSFTIWSLFTIISTAILYYTSPESFVMNFKLVPFLILVIIGTLMIPIQTSCEEYVFRGYLMQGFGNLARNKWFPLITTSSIFGLMHIANPEVTKMGYIVLVYYIGTGFFLGILTLMDEGMELSLGFHAANNLVGALLVTADWSAFQTHSILKDISEPSAGFDVIAPVLIIYPILLFIFAKKYNWTNWKEKLTGEIHSTNSNLINEIQGTND
ncbi:MAG: CPBP family intramembrane metalloprotease [Flavobacterium sp.]|uniref:CPBP family intramembrane glutamic endopeptidase n=1 Tax=Flavobacterium sp. TaxID=239 RepID=UPI0022C7A612|nr:CPBP family intramembrane glutamic endopeptidase [Flavobacterium sp.]MCZ8197061.1 CPBP family intramembrane metalloprotease [Flavobacterium sp.]